jgi:hypothetical protein
MALFGRKRRWREDYWRDDPEWDRYPRSYEEWRNANWDRYPRPYERWRNPYWDRYPRPYRRRRNPYWGRYSYKRNRKRSFPWVLRDFLIRLVAFTILCALGLAWVKFHFLDGMFPSSF